MLTPPMQLSQSGLKLTEMAEGCRLEAYQDSVGVWTIGYGHTNGVCAGQVITQEQADALAYADEAQAVEAVNRLVNIPLMQGEFDALVDFVFNLGTAAFASSTLLKLLNGGDLAGAASQFVLWDHAGGKELAGLLRRRLAEKQLFVDASANVTTSDTPIGA